MGHTGDPTTVFVRFLALVKVQVQECRKQIQRADIDWKEHTGRQAAGKPYHWQTDKT